MMTERDRAIFNEFADKVRLQIPNAQIWAFGSRARGDAQPDSDFDICVVSEHIDEAQHKAISHIAWEIGFENESFVQTLTYTRDEFENSYLVVSPLFLSIKREGVLL